jgi:hypothetical protein
MEPTRIEGDAGSNVFSYSSRYIDIDVRKFTLFSLLHSINFVTLYSSILYSLLDKMINFRLARDSFFSIPIKH